MTKRNKIAFLLIALFILLYPRQYFYDNPFEVWRFGNLSYSKFERNNEWVCSEAFLFPQKSISYINIFFNISYDYNYCSEIQKVTGSSEFSVGILHNYLDGDKSSLIWFRISNISFTFVIGDYWFDWNFKEIE